MADNIVIILCPECNTKFRFALPEKRLAKPNKKMKMRCLVCASQFSVRPKDLLGPITNPVGTQIRVQSSLHGMKTTKSWDTIRDWIQQGMIRGSDPISVFGSEWQDAADCSEISELFSSINSNEISDEISRKMSEEQDLYEQQTSTVEPIQEEIQQDEPQQGEIQQEQTYPSSVEVEFDHDSFEQEEPKQEEIQQEEIQQEEIQQEEIQQEEPKQETLEQETTQHQYFEEGDLAEEDPFYEASTLKNVPIAENIDNEIVPDENVGQDITNNEIDAEFDEFDSEEFQSTIFGDLQSIEDNLLRGTPDASKTIVNENFSASLFSDIGQEEEDDGFFRLSDGFEKSPFSTEDPFGVLGSEEDQGFPSAVNMEFDVEENAPIGTDNETAVLEDGLPEDNDEELDKPEFFEEEPAKNENIWSEEVEDEYSFDVQAYLSGVRSNSNSWEEGNDAFEDIDNFQASGLKKNLRVITAILMVLIPCLYLGYTLFTDSSPPVSAINPEVARSTFIEEQEEPAQQEDIASATDEIEKQPETERTPDINQIVSKDVDKKTPELETTKKDITLQLTPQPEQDFFAGLNQEQKAPISGWNDKEEILTIGSDLQNISREGWVAVHNRESMRAESLFRSVLQQNPNHIFALYGLGYVLEMRSNEATQLKENAQAANYKSKSTQVYCRLLQSKPDARTVSEVQGRVLNMGMSCIN